LDITNNLYERRATMENDREHLIQRAILTKLGNGIDMFTADDLLTVAGITEDDLEEIRGSAISVAVKKQPVKKDAKPNPAKKTRKPRPKKSTSL